MMETDRRDSLVLCSLGLCWGSSEVEKKATLRSANNRADSFISQASTLMKLKHQGAHVEEIFFITK